MVERTRNKRTREEYEDDFVSVNSSQEEEYGPDQEFLVERILAEKNGDDGRKLYLILWADYPEEMSTWEPRQNIRDSGILTAWKERETQEADGLESPFDLVKFNSRMQQLQQEEGERHRRRKGKRRLGAPISLEAETRRPQADDSDSTEAVESDDLPVISSPELLKKKKKKLKTSQKSKKHSQQSMQDSYQSSESDSGTSADSLIGELLQKNKKRAKNAALQSLRDKRAATKSKKLGDQTKNSSKKPSDVTYPYQGTNPN